MKNVLVEKKVTNINVMLSNQHITNMGSKDGLLSEDDLKKLGKQ